MPITHNVITIVALESVIVIAVIISTIIEMILPSNKNKKYIQMVIGVYVLFNIISPIISLVYSGITNLVGLLFGI